MEKRAAKRCQAWNSGERIADVPHPPHQWQMDVIFSLAAVSAYSIIVQAMTCSLSSLFLPHRFLTRVDTIVLFFLEEKKQGIPIMTEHQLSLLPFSAGWGIHNQRLVAAIAPLTVEQLALRLTPQHWSIGMYVTHIVANRAWFFHARMGEGGDDLPSLELWALGVCEADVDPLHPATELLAGLERTWQMIQETLAPLTPASLLVLFPP